MIEVLIAITADYGASLGTIVDSDTTGAADRAAMAWKRPRNFYHHYAYEIAALDHGGRGLCGVVIGPLS